MGTTTVYRTHEQIRNPALTSTLTDVLADGFEHERVSAASPAAPRETARRAAAESLADELQREAGRTLRATRGTEALVTSLRARQRAAWMSRGGRRLQPEMGNTGS